MLRSFVALIECPCPWPLQARLNTIVVENERKTAEAVSIIVVHHSPLIRSVLSVNLFDSTHLIIQGNLSMYGR